MYSLTGLIFILLGASWALATPLLINRQVTVLSIAELDGFAPYTQFARATYCGIDRIKVWTCGDACVANPDFQVTLTGGDGNDLPYWYVGYWPSENAVVTAHQGTDPSKLESILIDLDINKITLDPSLFPGAGNVEVHDGFVTAHAASAAQILNQVRSLIISKGATSVFAIGHSLGGALAELDTLFFTLNLPQSIAVKGVTFGTPRVGNANYASLFDSKVSNFKRINNKKDPVPTVPGRLFGFSHVNGEIHILGQDNAVACSGNDDSADPDCTILSVPNILEANTTDHSGPYQGISIGSTHC